MCFETVLSQQQTTFATYSISWITLSKETVSIQFKISVVNFRLNRQNAHLLSNCNKLWQLICQNWIVISIIYHNLRKLSIALPRILYSKQINILLKIRAKASYLLSSFAINKVLYSSLFKHKGIDNLSW